MGVFGPDGLSSTNVSATGKAITYPLRPSEHTTIQQLVKSASSYEFVLHPGTLQSARGLRYTTYNHYRLVGDLAYAGA